MKKFSAMVIAAIMGSAITIGSYQFFDEENSVRVDRVDVTPAYRTAFTTDENGEVVPLDFTAAADKVMPAVVHIISTSEGTTSRNEAQIPDQFRDFFGPFFRQNPQQQGPRVGSGSGVIISKDGYIVTNNHVIDKADEIAVTLNDNRSFDATVVGVDPTTDLALIKIEESNLDYLPLVNSDNIRVGEWVLAVGNPFNLTSTVTAGIVSAKGRNLNIIGDSTAIESFIQTDAAVNPGNSGGALTNLNGDLIGINTAIASPTGAYSGYAFAVPSNIVSKVVEDLIEYGVVQRGWLGVTIQNVNNRFAEDNDLDVISGAYVARISEQSGAKDAGVKEGDVIVSVDGRDVKTTADLIGYIGSKRPGDRVKLTVNREGSVKTYEVMLKNRDGNVEIIEPEIKNETIMALGLELEELTASQKEELKVDHGVQVKNLLPGKIRKYTDMREGFIILKVDGEDVDSVEDFAELMKGKSGGVLIEGKYPNSSRSYYYGLGM